MSSCKRSAEDTNPPSPTAQSSGGGTSSSGKRRKQDDALLLADGAADPAKACLLNPEGVPLAKVLLFLNVADIPSAVRTCKCWRDALNAVEDELWLGMVRRHYPSVECITNLLPDHIGKAQGAGEDAAHKSDDTPAPSRSWKRQFQRHKMMEERDTDQYDERPPPKSLDEYFFEVQYDFWHPQRTHLKRVGIVIESGIWDVDDDRDRYSVMRGDGNKIVLEFDRNRLAEAVSDPSVHTATSISLLVRMFERSTGRQTIIGRMSGTSKEDLFLNGSTGFGTPLFNFLRVPSNIDNPTLYDLSCAVSKEITDETIKIAILFGYDTGYVQFSSLKLDRTQILDIFQNKVAWK